MSDDKKDVAKPEVVKQDAAKQDKVDEELSDLLESALQDFSKDAKPEDKSKGKDDTVVDATAQPPAWSDEFIQQAASQFEANFQTLFGAQQEREGNSGIQLTPELLQEKLKQMADAAQQVIENPTQAFPESNDFGSSITQAIQGLNQASDGLQNPFSEDDLMRMFGGGGGGDGNELVPFMQGMMQGLLSKEVLGPSLQDFVAKLPAYIEANKTTLSAEEVERYGNQKKLMEKVLEELNKEQESDSQQEKSDRFTKVLELMQKLQDYGQPPAELVGECDTPFNFDPQGNPSDPGCSIM